MLSRVISAAVHGIEGYPVTVEVDFRFGMPAFSIVGLPDAGVRESRERVIAAIRNSGFTIPVSRITVNLAPGHIRKEGPSFDLPMAIGIMASSESIPIEVLVDRGFLGELGLDGSLRPVQGVLPSVIGLKKKGIKELFIPTRNAKEAALVDGIRIFPCKDLSEVVDILLSKISPPPFTIDRTTIFQQSSTYGIDFSEVKGQVLAKRALEIAAAGNHNVFLLGPPGSGKTLLAHRLPTILPDLDFDEALETTKIHSVAGILRASDALVATRPFRSPHHQISDAALIGGGSNPRPGEVSLAHRGVLFLDEFPEFGRSVLESLRQPMEDRFVTVVRVASAVTYPADFLLVAAANPCPCGYLGSQTRACVCPPNIIQRYRSKISGPILDRIDLQIEVPALKFEEITSDAKGVEPSSVVRERVKRARIRQKDRLKSYGMTQNNQMTPRHIKTLCDLDQEGKAVLRLAIQRWGLSARAYDRILKVARTIADLEGEERIRTAHVMEAVGYRILDREAGERKELLLNT